MEAREEQERMTADQIVEEREKHKRGGKGSRNPNIIYTTEI